jgi:ribosome-associated translation inhibitor RaiA
MQIQLNTDKNVQGADSVAEWAERTLRTRLERHVDQVTRIEVHLSDAAATRNGAHDKRCVLEARMAGQQPLAVSHEAERVADAMNGAADKLLRALDTAAGRRRDAHGRDSIRGLDQE